VGTAQEIILEAETLIETLLEKRKSICTLLNPFTVLSIKKTTFKKSQLLFTSHQHAFKRFEVIMGLSVGIKFWHEAQCSLVDTPKLFGGMCSPYVSTLIS